jgi:hypothetical protein
MFSCSMNELGVFSTASYGMFSCSSNELGVFSTASYGMFSCSSKAKLFFLNWITDFKNKKLGRSVGKKLKKKF